MELFHVVLNLFHGKLKKDACLCSWYILQKWERMGIWGPSSEKGSGRFILFCQYHNGLCPGNHNIVIPEYYRRLYMMP